MAPRLLLTCLGCAQDFDAAFVNCPTCCPGRMTEEHSRFKEAHQVAAFESAFIAAGGTHPDDEPATISVMEELPRGKDAPEDQPKRFRAVELDNSKACNAAAASLRLAEEAIYRGSEGAPRIHRGAGCEGKEAHVVLGDSIAIGHKVKAALEARNVRLAAERLERVKTIAAALAKDPASAIELAQKHDAAELTDALKTLGVEV